MSARPLNDYVRPVRILCNLCGKLWDENHSESCQYAKLDEDFKRAVYFANKALDEPCSDPDDDLRTVSRQFLRALEKLERKP